MWKWLLGIFVAIVAVVVGAGFFLTSTAQGDKLLASLKPKEKVTEVRTESVERGDLVRMVSAPGTIEPRTKVQISAQVSARIIALPFREGDEVKKGDVVVRLDADDYIASLQSAEASLKGEEARLAGLQAELINARAELTRIRDLYETKDVSKAAFDQAQAGFLRAEAMVKAGEHSIEIARANITRAQKNLDLTTILAPMDGTIILLNVEVGEQVLGTFNNAGSVIMEIADLSNMILRAKIDEINIVPVRAGQPAAISISGFQNRAFEGTVDLVGLKKQLDRDGTGFFETEILIHHTRDDGLRSGLNANVDVQVQTFPDVLRVPSQAVVDRRIDELPKELSGTSENIDRDKVYARVVYTIRDGKAVATPVTIGTSDLTHTMIVGGIKEGDTIITGPYRVLADLKHGNSVSLETKTEDPAAGGSPEQPVAEAGTKPAGAEPRGGS